MAAHLESQLINRIPTIPLHNQTLMIVIITRHQHVTVLNSDSVDNVLTQLKCDTLVENARYIGYFKMWLQAQKGAVCSLTSVVMSWWDVFLPAAGEFFEIPSCCDHISLRPRLFRNWPKPCARIEFKEITPRFREFGLLVNLGVPRHNSGQREPCESLERFN